MNSKTSDGFIKEAPGRLMREGELSRMLNVSVATVRSWRLKGRGPVFIRAVGAVRYDLRDVVQYLADCRVSHEQAAESPAKEP